MIKYKARIDPRWDCDAEIEEVEVERETEQSVWVNGSRSAKRSSWANFYDTWQEAHDALWSRQTSRINSVRMQLERSKSVLGNINGMKPPKEPA